MPVDSVRIAWYREKDYEALLDVFEDAATLPDTYREWRRIAERTDIQLKLQGHVVERAYIDPVTFPDWCRQRGLKLDAQSRSKFASESGKGKED